MKEFTYRTKGVCAWEITFNIENGILTELEFSGGCDGNLMGISRLVEGMNVEEVIKRLKGIDCEGKGTSCPDQLSKALEEYLETNTEEIA